jgi:hypothetical protein
MQWLPLCTIILRRICFDNVDLWFTTEKGSGNWWRLAGLQAWPETGFWWQLVGMIYRFEFDVLTYCIRHLSKCTHRWVGPCKIGLKPSPEGFYSSSWQRRLQLRSSADMHVCMCVHVLLCVRECDCISSFFAYCTAACWQGCLQSKSRTIMYVHVLNKWHLAAYQTC